MDDSLAISAPKAAPDGVSDKSLVQRYRAGNEEAATQLFRRYAASVQALAKARGSPGLDRLVDSDDIVQSVFRRFFASARAKNYEIPTSEDLWKILLVITLNRVRAEERFQRRGKRDVRLTRNIDALKELLTEDKHEASCTALQMAVQDELARLPALYQSIMTLRIEGYTISEIADRVCRSKRTVERMLQELRNHLSSAVERKDDNDSDLGSRAE